MSAAGAETPEYLSSAGCVIRITPGKGRGVFATRAIPSQTTVDISPVLLFEKEEYAAHGRYTILDHYTFVWEGGQYALALGLGSLFNHSPAPNLNYIRDYKTDSIRYVTSKEVQPGEELCIFYGTNLWFEDFNTKDHNFPPEESEGDPFTRMDLNPGVNVEDPERDSGGTTAIRSTRY